MCVCGSVCESLYALDCVSVCVVVFVCLVVFVVVCVW